MAGHSETLGKGLSQPPPVGPVRVQRWKDRSIAVEQRTSLVEEEALWHKQRGHTHVCLDLAPIASLRTGMDLAPKAANRSLLGRRLASGVQAGVQENVRRFVSKGGSPPSKESKRRCGGTSHIRELAVDHHKRRNLKHRVSERRSIEVAGVIDVRAEMNFKKAFNVDRARLTLGPQVRPLEGVRCDLLDLGYLVPKPAVAASIGQNLHSPPLSRSSGVSSISRLMTSGATLRSDIRRNSTPACGFRLR